MNKSFNSWIKGFVLDLLSDPRPEDKTLLPVPSASSATAGSTAHTSATSSSSSSSNAPNLSVVNRPPRIMQVLAVNHRLKVLNLSDGVHVIYAFLTPQCLQDYPTEEELKELKHSMIKLQQYHLTTYIMAGANRIDNSILDYRMRAPLVLQVSKLTVLGGHDVEQVQSSQDIALDPEVKRLYFQYHPFHLAVRLGKRQFGNKASKALPDPDGQAYSLPLFDEEHPLTEHECIIPSDQAKVISQITSFERSSILQRREDMLKQCDDEQTDVALISMKLFEDEGKSSPPAFIAMQEFLQNTLSETQVEEDEEFFPKGFNPVLTFSIVDGELAFTQVDETQVEEQDPTGGYRIEFINPEPILPRPAEPLPSNPIIQTQVPSSTVAVPVAENTAPSTTTVPTADVEIVVAASDAGKHQTTTTVAAPTMSAKALLSSAAEKQSKASNGKGQLKQSTLTMEKRSSSSSGSQKSAVATPRPQTVVPVLESTQVPTPEGKSSKQQVQDQIMPSIVPTKKSPPAESTPIEKPTITNKRASTKSSIGSPVHATKDTKNNVKKGRNDGYESDSSISSVRMTRSQVAALAALASNKETKKKDQKVALSKPASSSSSMKEEPKPSVDNQVGIRTRHQKSKAVATPDKARREAMVGRRVVKDFPNVGLVRGAVVAYRNNSYTVFYEDGDFEDLLFYQLTSILDPKDENIVDISTWTTYQQWSQQDQQKQQSAAIIKKPSQETASSSQATQGPSIAQRRSARNRVNAETNSLDTDKELSKVKAIHRELNQLLAPTPMAEIDMEMTQPQFGYQEGGEEKDTNTVKSKGKGKKRASPAFEQSDEESEVKYQPKNKKRLSSILEDDEDDEAVPPPQQQTKAFTGLSEQDKLLQKMKLLHKKLSDPSKKMVNKQVLSPSSSYQVPTLSSSTSSSLQVTNAASTSNKRPPYLVGWRKDSIVYKMVMLLQEKRKRISDQIDAANKLQGKETTFVASAKPFQEDYYYEDLEEEEEQPKKKAKTAKAVAAPLFQQFAMPPSPVKQSAPIPSQKSPMKNHRVVAAVEPPRGPPTSSSRASVSSSSSTVTTKQQQTPSTSSNASFPILTHQDILSKTLKFLQKKVNKKV